MSPIGKIFLLVNFGLAFGFLFWASSALSANAKWKAQYDAEVEAHAADQATAEEELSTLTLSLTNERDAKDARSNERDQAKAEASRNREELDAAKRANEQLRADIAKISETLDGYNQTIASLQSGKDEAVNEARELERERDASAQAADDAEQARADAEEALRAAQAQIAQLEKNLTSTRDELASAEAKIATVIAGGDLTGVAQPDISAQVLQVDDSIAPGLVALNKGSAHGVKRGMTFQIYNGASYKGYVRVENVQANFCSALIEGVVDGGSIGQGDSAATNL